MQYMLNNVKSYEPEGAVGRHFGYKTITKEFGEVWAEIPDELVEMERLTGRIRVPKKVVEAPVQPEVVAKPVEVQKVAEAVVVEEQAVDKESSEIVEESATKIDGRTKAAKANK